MLSARARARMTSDDGFYQIESFQKWQKKNCLKYFVVQFWNLIRPREFGNRLGNSLLPDHEVHSCPIPLCIPDCYWKDFNKILKIENGCVIGFLHIGGIMQEWRHLSAFGNSIEVTTNGGQILNNDRLPYWVPVSPGKRPAIAEWKTSWIAIHGFHTRTRITTQDFFVRKSRVHISHKKTHTPNATQQQKSPYKNAFARQSRKKPLRSQRFLKFKFPLDSTKSFSLVR